MSLALSADGKEYATLTDDPFEGDASTYMQLVTDLTVLEVAKAAEVVLERAVHVTAASDISRDLAVDSLALMNIVMELEDRFDISIPIDRLSEVQTVGDLASLIDSIRKKA